jgi:predicted transcriptional regulator
MARPKSETLTPREAEIMEILWRQGRATADQIRSAMADQPHDSTVRTLLRVLESKGHVRHQVAGGRYVYRPVITRRRAQRKAIETLLQRLFGGSAESLLLRMIEEEQITPEQLQTLRQAAPKPRKRRAKKGGRP